MANHKTSKLDAREETFCIHILAGTSQTTAYKLAFQPKRAKPKTIHEMASKLAATHKVRTRLAELFQPLRDQALMTRKEWLMRVIRGCRYDPRKMFDVQGNPKEVCELDDAEAEVLEGFEFFEEFSGRGKGREAVGVTKKFKLTPRLRYLELLGKAEYFYAERRELTGPDGQPLQPLTGIKVEFVDASPAR